jgi:hypothetical protein
MSDNLQTCIRRSAVLADSQAKHLDQQQSERVAAEESFYQTVLRGYVEEAHATFAEVVRGNGTVELTEPGPGGLGLFVTHGGHRGMVHFQSFQGRGSVAGMRYELECGSRRCQGCFDVTRSSEARAIVVRLLRRFARWVYDLDEEPEG